MIQFQYKNDEQCDTGFMDGYEFDFMIITRIADISHSSSTISY